MRNELPNFAVLDKCGSNLKVLVRYSNKAKYISIQIKFGIVELVLPNKDFLTGYKFLLTKESWIRHKLQNSTKQPPIDNKTIPIFDKTYSLLYIDADHHNIQIQNDVIHVYSRPGRHNGILIGFLQNKLLSEITAIIIILSKQYKLNFTEIKIRDNKTKWGSCSNKSVLSFNWRLIFTPEEILKYVIIHEMCHLLEMNHSQRFWDLVEGLYPDYKSAKLWLKENGNRIYQYLKL